MNFGDLSGDGKDYYYLDQRGAVNEFTGNAPFFVYAVSKEDGARLQDLDRKIDAANRQLGVEFPDSKNRDDIKYNRRRSQLHIDTYEQQRTDILKRNGSNIEKRGKDTSWTETGRISLPAAQNKVGELIPIKDAPKITPTVQGYPKAITRPPARDKYM